MGVARETLPLDILLVEDEHDIADTVSGVLRDEGHHPVVVHEGTHALELLDDRLFDLIIADVNIPGCDGFSVLEQSKSRWPDRPVILMSRYASIAEAVSAVKREADHYLDKPLHVPTLLEAIAEVSQGQVARKLLAEARGGDILADRIIGTSPAIVALREKLAQIGHAEGPVLITGETGTGKDLVAQAVHELSDRSEGPYVAINCAAFPDTLLDSELFGHERGAFTGATQARQGRFRAADGGTLFLDEIGEMSANAQAKLLRVLESQTLQPLGSDETEDVDVRLVAATNADLSSGSDFRSDLYYRIKMFRVRLPPLRERRGDIPLLVEHFLHSHAENPPRITPQAWSALTHYDYPGNVRELKHAVEHGVVLSEGAAITARHLPEELSGAVAEEGDSPAIQPLVEAERDFQRGYLVRTLQATEWNRTRAAEILGISRKTLWKKLRDLGINQKAS